MLVFTPGANSVKKLQVYFSSRPPDLTSSHKFALNLRVFKNSRYNPLTCIYIGILWNLVFMGHSGCALHKFQKKVNM